MAANQKNTVDKAEKPEVHKPSLKLNAGETYTIIGTGKSRHLAKGTEHVISGADAALLIENGRATLKAK